MTKAEDNPHAKTPKGELADRWGALKSRKDKIDDEIDSLKAEFERRGLKVAEGAKFAIVKSVRTFMALKIRAIRAEMGETWCKAREEPQDRTTFEISRASAKEKAA